MSRSGSRELKEAFRLAPWTIFDSMGTAISTRMIHMTSMEPISATERLFNAIKANDFAGAVRAMDAGASLSATRGADSASL